MDSKKIPAEVNNILGELLQLIASFNMEQFNIIPFKDSWTAGQLAQHVVMYTAGFLQMLNGNVKDTERAPDEMVEKIKTDFLNFDIKMQSPDFIAPAIDNYNKETLSHALKDTQAAITHATETLDLSKTCMSFEIPVYGFLTRLEAISFIVYHTQRHVHQLKKIQQAVVGSD